MVLAPGRAAKRVNHETEESFRSLPFPLYGLPPTWRGRGYALTRTRIPAWR